MFYYLFLLAILIYCCRTAFMSIGAKRARASHKPYSGGKLPRVSVIVPARNEENNIQFCINSLAKSDYPSDKYEIIAVNDRSTDNTGAILDELKADFPNLNPVHVTDETANKNLRGKPGALQAGINQAKGEVILMTDADCTVSPGWIKSLASQYSDKELGMLASHTLIKGSGVFDKIQAVEWVYMHTMASAGVGNGIPLGCYGNNVSVRATDYNNLGGYEKIKFSVTEDMALQMAMHGSGRKVKYHCTEQAAVHTIACPNLYEYLKQHRRWAVGGLGLGWKAVIFVGTSLAMWLGIFLGICTSNWTWVAVMFGLRVACDSLVIMPALHILKQKQLSAWMVPAIVFFTLMELFIPFTVLSRKIEWKGQVFGE